MLGEMRLEAGEVEEARVLFMEAALLDSEADSSVEAAHFETAVRFQETGDPQPFRFPDNFIERSRSSARPARTRRPVRKIWRWRP
ncbi:MAG: hypothetical protein WEG36_09800 [Gemmatimonadota bacterium]